MTRQRAVAFNQSSHCVICGDVLSFHQQWAGDICGDWRCRWTRLDRDMEAHRQEAARILGETQPGSYCSRVVPYRPGTIESLPAGRRAIHLEYLSKLVMKATQGEGCDGVSRIEPGKSR